MRKIALVAPLVLAVVFMASCGGPTVTKTAEGIVDSIAKGDFASATADFDATMKTQLPADKLGQVWTQVTALAGPFKERKSTRETQEQGYNVVYVTCQFERADADLKVVFDNSKQVTGFFVVPIQAAPAGK